MPSATLPPCPFWCWCISRPCRKAELPRTHIAKLWAMQCMPGVPLDMPICCPSVFAKHASSILLCLNAAQVFSQACQKKQQCSVWKHISQVKLAYRRKAISISGENPMSRQKRQEEAIHVASGCSRLRQLTLALSRDWTVRERNDGQNNGSCEEPLKESAFSC